MQLKTPETMEGSIISALKDLENLGAHIIMALTSASNLPPGREEEEMPLSNWRFHAETIHFLSRRLACVMLTD